MHKERIRRVLSLCFIVLLWSPFSASNATEVTDYERARWDPIHFKPAIDNATDEQCLACHQEVLEPSVKPQSPAGVKATDTLAWYQTLDVYSGDQETFHRRHLVTPLAKKSMNLKCNFCHQGNGPRDETPYPDTQGDGSYTLRKMVNPEETCLRCHGQFNYKIMTGLPGHWNDVREMMGNSCLSCHAIFRTERHQVNYLNADAIEAATKEKTADGKESSDVCFGCHGGRAWYQMEFPYPRHAWKGQDPKVPDWAKDRPTESEERFRLPAKPVTEKVADKVVEKVADKPAAAAKADTADKPAESATDAKKASD